MSVKRLKYTIWISGIISLILLCLFAYLITFFKCEYIGWIFISFIYGLISLIICLIFLIKKNDPDQEIFNKKF